MADLSYTVAVSGHEDLPKLAAGITAVATALGNGKDIAQKLAEFKAAMGGMGGSLDGLKGLEGKLDSFKKTLSSKLDGLDQTVKNELKTIQSTVATSVGGISAEFEKIGKAAAAGLDKSGAAIKIAADRNLKLNAKYATDIETAVRQIQEKGTSSMLQSLQNRASNVQRILQSEAKDAVAIAQKTYGTDFVAAMQKGLQGQLSVLTNAHEATMRLKRTQHEQMIAEGRKAAAKLANIQAQAQVKAATLNPMGNYSSMRSGREFQIKNAQLFMNMPSKADFEAATALAVKDARDAQAKAMMQVRAATNNPVGAFQRYNSSTQTAGALIGANSTNALTGSVSAGSVSAAIPKAQDIGQVKQLSTAFQKLAIDGNDVHSAMRGLASGFNLLWLTWGKLAPLFAGASISFGLKKTFDIGSEVEYQIKFMETLGQTTKEQGKIIRQALRDIDQTTQFSLVELSQAMVRLGQAGQTPAEALATLKPAADLASVGMTDLKVATDLLIQTQALFGKSAADSGKIAAQIFVATKSGVLNVEDIAGSMKYASEANTRFGKSLEETLTILGALAQAGLKGSTGGTAYINFLRDINGRSGPAVKALANLGKATGKTIEVFDSLGKQRSAVDIFNDISNAADKLSAKDADKILSRIFSDRGGRTFYAMVREGTIDLQKMVDVLKDVKPEELLKGAQGLMDTTKGALNILQGAMVGALDKVFEVNSDKFKAFIVDITKAIDSKEFLLSVQAMVAGALSLYETIKNLLPILMTLGEAWLVFKAASIGITVFQTLASVLAGMVPVLGMTTKSTWELTKELLTSTSAWQANGLAVIENTALQRAAASGMNATAAAAAGTAAKTAVAGVGMRALSGVIGFMANPIVGVITTLGLLGYAFWSAKKDATASIADTTESVLENGKINIAQWDKEIIRLRERNNLMGQTDGYSGAEAQAKVAQQALALEVKEYERLAKAKDFADRRGSGFSVGDQKRMDESLERIKKGQRDINKVYSDVEAARLKDMSDREEKERQAEAKRNAGNKPQGTTPLPKKTSKPFVEKDRFYDDKTLQNLQKQMDDELSVVKARFDSERAIQDSEYKNLLVTQGQYQASMLASAVAYEQDSIAVIESGIDEYLAQYVKQYDEIRKLRDKAKPGSDDEKRAEAQLQALVNDTEARVAASTAKIEKIKLDSNKRQLLAAQDLAGETRKLIKADEEYWTKSKLETDKIESMQKVAEQYRNINTSVFSNATALKAEAEAIAESKVQHEGQLQNMRKEIELRMDAIAALEAQIELEKESATYTGNNAVWQELSRAKGLNAEELARLKARYSKSVEEGITDGARRGALAYQKEMDAKAAELTNVLADAIETALTEGGAAGAKKLKAYLLKALIIDPIMVEIKASIQPMVGQMIGGGSGASGGGTSGGGGGGGLGNIGGLSNAYNAFAKSGVGQSLGLSNSGAYVGNNPSAYSPVGGSNLTSLGQAGAKAMGMVGDALAGYAMGSMFNSLISGGYSMGKGMNTFQKVGTAVGSAIGGPVVGAIIGAAAGALNRIFGRKLKDSGIQGEFGGSRGFEGESFEFYKGGLLRSDKTKTNPLAEEARKVLGDAFNLMRIQVGTFATSLGLNTDKIADFTTKIKVSTKGLSDADAEKAIQEALATANNELAEQVIGTWEEATTKVKRRITERTGTGDDISYSTRDVEEDVTTRTYKASEYAREGEKAIDTLTRLATSLAATNEAFKDLGIGLYEASLAGADMASQLVDLFGGIEGFVAATAAYYDKFYSEDEKREAKRRRVEAAFAEAGLSMPDINAADARAQFRATMESIDLTTEAGRKQWATLVQVSGMYADITEGAVDAASAMREAAEAAKKLAEDQLAELNRRRKLLSDYAQEDFKRAVERDQALLNTQADALKETMGTLKSAIDSLTAGAKDIYNTVDSTSTAAAAQGMVAIEDALAGVRAGGSLNDYTGLMDSVSAARAGLNSNAYVSQFERDRDALVLAGQLSDLASFGQTEYDVQEQQLNAIEAQLDYLKDLSEKADMFISGLSTLTGTVDYYFNRFMAVGVPNAREVLPSFAVGTNYVPNDMVAQIHEGEAIIPKAYNPSAGGGGNSSSVVEAIQTLTAEVANLKFAMAATAKNTSGLPQLVDHFDNVTEGGNAMRVEAI